MRRLFPLLAVMLLLSACSPKNELGYFVDTKDTLQGTLNIVPASIKIEPFDELVINVTSEDPAVTAIYNIPFNTSTPQKPERYATMTPTVQTYKVDAKGDIVMPVLGKIHVAGLTTVQLAEELTRRISEQVEAPLVLVELVNFKVNVMGEVTDPGSYTFNTERVTVLDALATAGDMTVFGKRDNVTVYREENGQVTYRKLNLNDSEVISDPYYYLKQNDVIYVEPGSARRGQAEYNQNNSYKVSVVSAIASAASVVASLVIALVVK